LIYRRQARLKGQATFGGGLRDHVRERDEVDTRSAPLSEPTLVKA